MMDTTKSVLLTGFGGYDKIALVENPRPKASARKVVVQMKACGMNFSDLYTRQGLYTFQNKKPPLILGLEGAGIIFEVGENITKYKIGDRVVCWNFHYGMWSEFVELPENNCFPIPDAMTFEEAACIVVNYLTAYFVVLDFGNLRPGQNILIQSVAGGVGWAATQIAHTIENVTVFGTASVGKHDVIKENGVAYPIDYNSTDFVEEVLRLSPSGVDVVLDCLSGSDFTNSRKLLKPMGRLIHVGISNMVNGEKTNFLKACTVWWQTKNFTIVDITNNNIAICGFNLANIYKNDPQRFRFALEQVVELYKDGKIKPRIDSVFSFDEVVNATMVMVNRKNIGKLILVPSSTKEENRQENKLQSHSKGT